MRKTCMIDQSWFEAKKIQKSKNTFVHKDRPIIKIRTIWITFNTIILNYLNTGIQKLSLGTPFWSYKSSKLRGTRPKGRNSAVKSSQLSWTGQYRTGAFNEPPHPSLDDKQL